MDEILENGTASILLCEDDENLGMLLREFLNAKGYEVDLCINGEKGLVTFSNSVYDLCILDINMPKMDGFTLARKIKDIKQNQPIVFLTAKNQKEDVLKGFGIGADDYMVKPFSMEEIVARIEAILRRVKGARIVKYNLRQIGSFSFNVQTRTLTRGEEVVKLTTKETELLILLSNRANEILLRDIALKSIWADDNHFNARSMDVYITKLRKILKDDENAEIVNIHGKGYKLVIGKDNIEKELNKGKEE